MSSTSSLFKPLRLTSVDTEKATRNGFAVQGAHLFVGRKSDILQFVLEDSPDASNSIVINAKLDVVDIAAGDSDTNELFVLSTYSTAVRDSRAIPPTVYPLFVSLFEIESENSAVELFCQPLPVHDGLSAAFAYTDGLFVVAHGAESGSRALLYRRVHNGNKALFQEVGRAALPQLPNVLNAALVNGVVLLYNATSFVTWEIRAGSAAEPSGAVAVSDLSAATLTPRGHVVTGSTAGDVRVFDAVTCALLDTFNINMDASKSLHPFAKRALPGDDGPSAPGDELTIEAAVAAANAAATVESDDDDDESEEDTVFANSYHSDNEDTETEMEGSDADMSKSSSSSGGSSSGGDAASTGGDAAAASGTGLDVFNEILNIAFSKDTLYVHTYADDLLLFGYA